jgi:hypothetical protein
MNSSKDKRTSRGNVSAQGPNKMKKNEKTAVQQPAVSPNLQKYQKMLNELRKEVQNMQRSEIKQFNQILDVLRSPNDLEHIPDTVPTRRKFVIQADEMKSVNDKLKDIHDTLKNQTNPSTSPQDNDFQRKLTVSNSVLQQETNQTIRKSRSRDPPPLVITHQRSSSAPPRLTPRRERSSSVRSPPVSRPRSNSRAPVPWIPQGKITTRSHNTLPRRYLKDRLKVVQMNQPPEITVLPSHSVSQERKHALPGFRTRSISPSRSSSGEIVETIIGGRMTRYEIPPPLGHSSSEFDYSQANHQNQMVVSRSLSSSHGIADEHSSQSQPPLHLIHTNPSSIFMSWPKDHPLHSSEQKKNSPTTHYHHSHARSFDEFFESPTSKSKTDHSSAIAFKNNFFFNSSFLFQINLLSLRQIPLVKIRGTERPSNHRIPIPRTR